MLTAKNLKYLYLLVIIGIIVYFPIFFNGFVWDDIAFIVLNPQVHQFNLITAFGPNIFNTAPFYRPIPATYFALLYAIFGPNAFFYHFPQLILHCVDAYLVFLLFRLFFGKRTSLLLAIVFLVHPINVESVAYIGQSELLLLFVLSAFLLSASKQISNKRLAGIGLFILLGTLTKETGILVLPVILAYRYLYKINRLIAFTATGIAVSLVYLLLRTFAADSLANTYSWIPIAIAPLPVRLLNIPAIITYYFQTVVFPIHLSISQIWIVTKISSPNFLVPIFVCVILGSLLAFALYKTKKHSSHTVLLFFSIWFLVNLFPLLQIIPLELTVADRWFYTSLIGLLGIVGVIVTNSKLNRKYLFTGAVIIILLLSLRTFIRTFDWHDDITINKHDLQDQPHNFVLMDDLAMAYMRTGDTKDALTYDKQSIAISPQAVTIGHLGNIYYARKQFGPAKNAYLKAISMIGSDPTGQFAGDLQQYYINMAAIYLRTGHPESAINLLQNKALKQLPQSHTLYILLSYSYYKAHDQQKALDAAAQAYRIYPNAQYAAFYERLQKNLPVDIGL